MRALCWLGGDRLLAVQAAWSTQGGWGGVEGAGDGQSTLGQQQLQHYQQQSHMQGEGNSRINSTGSGYGGDVLVELQVLWSQANDGDDQQVGGQQQQQVGGGQQQQQQQLGIGAGVLQVSVVAAPVCTSLGTRVLKVVPHSGNR